MGRITAKRLRSISIGAAALVAGLAIVIAALYAIVAPMVVESIMIEELQTLGLHDGYTVRRSGLSELRFDDLRFSEGATHRIERMAVAYSPVSLLQGRLSTVTLDEATWTIEFADDGSIRWGFETPADAADDDPAMMFEIADVPFETLLITNLKVVVARDTDVAQIAAGARFEKRDDGGATVMIEGAHGDATFEAEVAMTAAATLSEANIRLSAPRSENLPWSAFGVREQAGALPALREISLEVGYLAKDDAGFAMNIHITALRMDSGELTITSPELWLRLDGAAGNDRDLSAAIRSPSSFAFAGLSLGADRIAEHVTFEITPVEASRFATASEAGSTDIPLAIGIRASEPLSLVWREITLATQTLTAEVGVVRHSGSAGGGYGLRGVLDVRDANVNDHARQLIAGDIDATVPVTINTMEIQELGAFTIAELSINGEPAPPVAGTLMITRDGVRANAQWPYDDDEFVRGELAADFGDDAAGAVTVSADRLTPQDSTFFGYLGSGENAARVSGTFAVEGRVAWGGGVNESNLAIAIEDASFTRDGSALAFQGIVGLVRFDGLDPLSTEGVQRLTFEGGAIGDFDLQGGAVSIAFDAPGLIHIESAMLDLGSFGRLTAAPFDFEIDQPRLRLEVQVADARLGAWLPQLTDSRVDGEGALSGQFALTVRPDSESDFIALGDGQLSASPSRGWIEVRDREALEDMLLESNALEGGDDYTAEVKQRIVDALVDFEFDAFRVDLEREGADTVARIFTRGRGRQEVNPVPIGGLQINIRGLDDAITTALALERAFGRFNVGETND